MHTLKKYADFNGRASKSEFWCFFVFVIVANAVTGLIGLLLGFGPMLSGLVGLLLIVPQIAVAVRRLHDLSRAGRELLVRACMLALCRWCFRFAGSSPRSSASACSA